MSARFMQLAAEATATTKALNPNQLSLFKIYKLVVNQTNQTACIMGEMHRFCATCFQVAPRRSAALSQAKRTLYIGIQSSTRTMLIKTFLFIHLSQHGPLIIH